MMQENLSQEWVGTGEEQIYVENILDHYKYPHNFAVLENYTHRNKQLNPLCGDEIELFLTLANNTVQTVSFQGKGCAISMAAASMLTDFVKGKTVEEVKNIDNNQIIELLGIKLGIVRIKCGLLALNVLQTALTGGNQNGISH